DWRVRCAAHGAVGPWRDRTGRAVLALTTPSKKSVRLTPCQPSTLSIETSRAADEPVLQDRHVPHQEEGASQLPSKRGLSSRVSHVPLIATCVGCSYAPPDCPQSLGGCDHVLLIRSNNHHEPSGWNPFASLRNGGRHHRRTRPTRT